MMTSWSDFHILYTEGSLIYHSFSCFQWLNCYWLYDALQLMLALLLLGEEAREPLHKNYDPKGNRRKVSNFMLNQQRPACSTEQIRVSMCKLGSKMFQKSHKWSDACPYGIDLKICSLLSIHIILTLL